MTYTLNPVLDKYKAFLFDLDATLIFSNELWQKVDAALYEFLGLKEAPIDFHDPNFHGMSFNELNKILLSHSELDLTIEDVEKFQTDLITESYGEVEMTPGAADFVRSANQQGKICVICTSTHRPFLDSFLRKQAAKSGLVFNYTVTSDEAGMGKPNPAVYLMGAKLAGVDPSECACFEDSLPGGLAGFNAGCDLFSVPYGIHRDDSLEELKKISVRFLENGFIDLLVPEEVPIAPISVAQMK